MRRSPEKVPAQYLDVVQPEDGTKEDGLPEAIALPPESLVRTEPNAWRSLQLRSVTSPSIAPVVGNRIVELTRTFTHTLASPFRTHEIRHSDPK